MPATCTDLHIKDIVYKIYDLFENPCFVDTFSLFMIVMIILIISSWVYDIYCTIRVGNGF